MNGYAFPIHTGRHLDPYTNGSYGIILPLLISNYWTPSIRFIVFKSSLTSPWLFSTINVFWIGNFPISPSFLILFIKRLIKAFACVSICEFYYNFESYICQSLIFEFKRLTLLSSLQNKWTHCSNSLIKFVTYYNFESYVCQVVNLINFHYLYKHEGLLFNVITC